MYILYGWKMAINETLTAVLYRLCLGFNRNHLINENDLIVFYCSGAINFFQLISIEMNLLEIFNHLFCLSHYYNSQQVP